MNSLIQYKTTILPLLIAGVLACFGRLPKAEAVVPAPDGGYRGGNTAEGQDALFRLTTGGFNTAAGWLSLRSITTGSFNTAIGAGTLFANTADQNTATGAGALLSNTTGSQNTANGAFALFSNTEGNFNTASGDGALFSNTTGYGNTATGTAALNGAGDGAAENTANGAFTLSSNTTGSFNTATGYQALFNNAGDSNTAIGRAALASNTTGTGNTALGFGAGDNVTTASNVICIGASISGANVSNTCFIGNIRDVTTANNDAIPVVIDSAGQLGTRSSSRRFKKEIKPMDKASEALLALKPVTFHYKTDATDTRQFGLIAEEVAEVNPDLVVRDKDGEIYTVRYDAVNAMLLNEFLKEHRRNEEQEATIAQLKKEMETVVARLKEHDSKIQRVSTHIELSGAVGQTALNNR